MTQRRAKKTAELRKRLCSIELTVNPVEFDGEDEQSGADGPYTLFTMDMRINGILLTPDQGSVGVSVLGLWLSQRYEGKFTILTCSCGTRECAGFWDPVVFGRKGEFLHWTFSECYFKHFAEQGFISGEPRKFMIALEAADFHQQLEAVLDVVRAEEKRSGKPSGFASGQSELPSRTLDEQIAWAHEYYLHFNGNKRFARHIGKPAGVCAGA